MMESAGCCAGLADASGALQIAPLDLSSSAAPPGPVASSLDSEATGSEALLGSSAPSPSTVLPLHPSQVGSCIYMHQILIAIIAMVTQLPRCPSSLAPVWGREDALLASPLEDCHTDLPCAEAEPGGAAALVVPWLRLQAACCSSVQDWSRVSIRHLCPM